MAAKILAYNQCKISNDSSKIPSEIVIRDKNGNIVTRTVFSKGSTDVLGVIGIPGDWGKKWTLTNPVSKEIKTGNGDTFPVQDLGCGSWIGNIDILDK